MPSSFAPSGRAIEFPQTAASSLWARYEPEHAEVSERILVAARLPAQILQKPAHRVEFRAEARPVS